jgi:hypothetical protein
LVGEIDVSVLTVGPLDPSLVIGCAASCLVAWTLGFRPIPPSLAGWRERFLHVRWRLAQPFPARKSRKFLASACPPQIC